MGSEIENRIGLKWYPTSKASSSSCYNSSNLSIREQISKSVEKVVGYRILPLKLWRHRSFERHKESSQNFGANNSIQVGHLWREDEVKLPNIFNPAMVQLNSPQRRLQKDDTP